MTPRYPATQKEPPDGVKHQTNSEVREAGHLILPLVCEEEYLLTNLRCDGEHLSMNTVSEVKLLLKHLVCEAEHFLKKILEWICGWGFQREGLIGEAGHFWLMKILEWTHGQGFQRGLSERGGVWRT